MVKRSACFVSQCMCFLLINKCVLLLTEKFSDWHLPRTRYAMAFLIADLQLVPFFPCFYGMPMANLS